MRNLFRRCIGLVIALPYAFGVSAFSLFVGRKRAVAFWGPRVAAFAKRLVVLTLPRLKNPSEFDQFGPRLKSNMRPWRPIYDFSVECVDRDTVQLLVSNCPFCEAFDAMGLSEMKPFVCQGDWDAARVHAGKWVFERAHQIGTGDAFCDHTYKRLKAGSEVGEL
jgi:hypothetical protein